MGGGAQYPYPKEVWSPSGGWWTRPTNWRSNTAIIIAGSTLVFYSVFKLSAHREQRMQAPNRWIPSMLWAREFKEGIVGIRNEDEEWPKGAPVEKGHH
ncbi:hypothetical protein PTTG_26053 [Puccinia triticina 1-1 BBBD Race 1]|uniref:Uncharacterized protein n=2 Tax=Puccinia triticina TaxID=208348 RepID=A0A180GYK3_PUCT1|nr:uncharacterized protein PtA15_9A621 [Puccinia triticina]OAV97439.1 hypothetical protein PTTG_26053 [Puccinia triticina 1-1 BBBD Race 1]WAQ88494.1 hypothetical protein PtA15_9A621 [Puccinia triticina]WAR60669.1 hypothetical protein PtB15_9B608 [Puccinia triticina]